MEISAEKSEIIINSSNTIRSRIANGQELEIVKEFKYIGATISKVCTNMNSIGETEPNLERQEHRAEEEYIHNMISILIVCYME